MTIDKDVLMRLSEELLDKLNTIPDGHLYTAEALRHKQLNIIQGMMIKFSEENHESMTTSERIDDLISGGWREEMFKRFWDIYAKKVQYTPTLRKWMRLPKKDITAIMEVVTAYVAAHPDKKYRPNPLTFLNQRRWEDEIDGFVKSAPKPKPERENTWSYGL